MCNRKFNCATIDSGDLIDLLLINFYTKNKQLYIITIQYRFIDNQFGIYVNDQLGFFLK